jgi:hypothetical protein
MYNPGELDIMILSNGGMVMQFTQSLAYTRLLAKGVKIIDSRFRPLAKLDDDRQFEAIMEIAMETIDESTFDITYFVRNENELDEMEYELHMTLQADLTSYLVNEIREITRLKKEIVF